MTRVPRRTSLRVALWLGVFAVSTAGPALAGPIMYRFSGHIYWQPNTAINPVAIVGDSFEGYFVTDTAAANQMPGELRVATYTSPIQSVQVRFDSGYIAGGQTHMLVTDDVYGSAFVSLAGPYGYLPTPLDGQHVSGFAPASLGVWLVSSGIGLNPSLSLDVSNLMDYNLRLFEMEFGRRSGPGSILFYPLYGTIDMVSRADVVTPEPATLLLLGTGVAGVIARSRLKRKERGTRV